MQVKGEVTYNGYGFDECIVGRTAAYVDQNDNHIAELTVRETLVRLTEYPKITVLSISLCRNMRRLAWLRHCAAVVSWDEQCACRTVRAGLLFLLIRPCLQDFAARVQGAGFGECVLQHALAYLACVHCEPPVSVIDCSLCPGLLAGADEVHERSAPCMLVMLHLPDSGSALQMRYTSCASARRSRGWSQTWKLTCS